MILRFLYGVAPDAWPTWHPNLETVILSVQGMKMISGYIINLGSVFIAPNFVLFRFYFFPLKIATRWLQTAKTQNFEK